MRLRNIKVVDSMMAYDDFLSNTEVLFLLEKQGLETKDSILNIVNLFDGAVFILNEKSHDMLFKTEKLGMNGYILEKDGNITDKAIFLILG